MSCYEEVTSLTALDARAHRHGISASVPKQTSIDNVLVRDIEHHGPNMLPTPVPTLKPKKERIWQYLGGISLRELYGSRLFTTPSGIVKKVPGDLHHTVYVKEGSPLFGSEVHWTLRLKGIWEHHGR